MGIGHLVLACCAAMLLGACGNNERSFDLPLSELKQRVGEVEVSPIMLQSRGVSSDREVSDDKIAWKLYANGEEVFRLVAALAATDATRSTLTLTLEPGDRMKVQQTKSPDGVKAIEKLYLIAQEEQILSHVERRPLDMSRIMAATVRATMANQDKIFGRGQAVADEARRRDRENVDRTYEQARETN